jgi:hypothetical protein
MSRLEKSAHRKFKQYNEHEAYGSGRTEWFRINPIRLIRMIAFLFFKAKYFQCSDRLQSLKK